MKSAFVDTSALAAILFEEPASPVIRGILENYEIIFASNLLEAEIRSAAVREKLAQEEVDKILLKVEWFHPERPLSQELKTTLSGGIPLRGADLWHVACALYLAGNPSTLAFVTLDGDQAQTAARVGFKVLPEPPSAGVAVHELPALYQAGKAPRKRARKGKR